jgi:hypothetical protein
MTDKEKEREAELKKQEEIDKHVLRQYDIIDMLGRYVTTMW